MTYKIIRTIVMFNQIITVYTIKQTVNCLYKTNKCHNKCHKVNLSAININDWYPGGKATRLLKVDTNSSDNLRYHLQPQQEKTLWQKTVDNGQYSMGITLQCLHRDSLRLPELALEMNHKRHLGYSSTSSMTSLVVG